MRARLRSALDWLVCAGLAWIGVQLANCQEAGRDPVESPLAEVTNVVQLRNLATQDPGTSYCIQLEGDLWWVRSEKGRMVLADGTGAEELELDLRGFSVTSGQRVRLTGNGTITSSGAAFRLGPVGPIVDNDGTHSLIERSGAAYLHAGVQPIRVEWFNGVEKYGLEVQFAGPGFARRPIPNSALLRAQVDMESGTSNLVAGLDYRDYQGTWEALPDFLHLTPFKQGFAKNFDTEVMSRSEKVGLEFSGFMRVPRDGLYRFFLSSDDGSRLFVGEPSLHLENLGPAGFSEPRLIAIGQPLGENERGKWARVEGKVNFVWEDRESLWMELSAGAAALRLELADRSGLSPGRLIGQRVRATGFCQPVSTADGHRIPGILLVPGAAQIENLTASPEISNLGTNPIKLHLLTTAAEVHGLKREEAQRQYPVQLRGVITCVLPEHQAFTLEDITRGVYVVDDSASWPQLPHIGEFLEIEGATDPGLFAPVVHARRLESLGAGHMPEPVRPTWDQLVNGSLDAQYVETEGIITDWNAGLATLRLRGGVVNVDLRVPGVESGHLRNYENALVRIRGCLFATWDYVTHHVKVGEIRIYGANIMVEQPAPADLFAVPKKSAEELLLFDPQATGFQRVRVCGQVVYARPPEYFMMDGGHGLRCIVAKDSEVLPGDLVEAVGFPELSGSASPLLRHTIMRKLGVAALPEAKRLPAHDLLRADYDATRVQVEGVLVSARHTAGGQVLELQSGVRSFAACYNTPRHETLASFSPGSRLDLIGVYAAQGGNRAAGQDIASFELLVDSPRSIHILARPPWWTLERLLVIVGALAFVLAVTMLWITQLHRQVAERTTQLETQIQDRQRVEHQRALEQERTRVAQDLHDDLGSGLTEISMLVSRAGSPSSALDKRVGYLERAGNKARELVTSLDEIVWAMNPSHDSLSSLVSYFCLYADRFLGLANIRWRLAGPAGPPDQALDWRHRHQLFLAFKEALNNVVRHSAASEVALTILAEEGELRLTVHDNGRGLAPSSSTLEMDGVANMRTRIEKLGGRFETSSEAGCGTKVRFSVPFH